MPVPVTRRHDAHRFAQPRSAEISLNRDSSAFSQNAGLPLVFRYYKITAPPTAVV